MTRRDVQRLAARYAGSMPDYDSGAQTSGRLPLDDDGRPLERFDHATRSYYTLLAEGFPKEVVAVLMLMRHGWLAGLQGGPNDGGPR